MPLPIAFQGNRASWRKKNNALDRHPDNQQEADDHDSKHDERPEMMSEPVWSKEPVSFQSMEEQATYSMGRLVTNDKMPVVGLPAEAVDLRRLKLDHTKLDGQAKLKVLASSIPRWRGVGKKKNK